MNNANLSQEISRLYKDLSDHILARDWEGTNRIYQELLRAGQSLETLTARIPAIQNTSPLELFGEQAAEEPGSRILDSPTPQGNAKPGLVGESIIERAAERLDWKMAFGTRHDSRRGLEGTRNQESQTEPARVARVLPLRFGHAGPTPLPLIFCLVLVSVLAVAAAGSGVFLLTHPAQENATAESVPAPEASAKAPQNNSSIGDPPMTPRVTVAAQSVTPAGVTPTTAPTLSASELGAEPEARITPSAPPPDGPVPTAARTPTNKPEVAMTPATPTVGTTSTVVPLALPKPPTKPAFSGAEITTLLARGDWLFATGDVVSARLLYERAAEAGGAQGAVRLGKTFDPIFLERAHVREARGCGDGRVLVSSRPRPWRDGDHQSAEKSRSKITLSRTSRNQTGDFEDAPPSAIRAIWDDLPIHIRPNLPAARVQTQRTQWVQAITAHTSSHHLRFVANKFCSQAAMSPFVRD